MRTLTKRRTLIVLLSIAVVCFFVFAFWAGGRREVALEGTFQGGFEASAFFPDGDCSKRPFWFQFADERNYDMNARIRALGFPDALHVKLIANISRLGMYGHLGAYRREVWPIKIISVDSAPPCWPGEPRPYHLISPDHELVAIVRSTKPTETILESRVELKTRDAQGIDGPVFASRTYISADGKHGYGVARAGWTPDSQFFVYSLESSGDHQSGQASVHFFSRKDNKIVELDQILKDAVSSRQFLISAPDRVTVELWSSKEMRIVSLSSLAKP
jgi:hypothetical protein